MAVTSETNQNPQPIIDLILADINGIIPNLSSLVASYRLLVGASEEIHRTPEVCPEVFERAVKRADNAGTLIDVFIELLYCKIAFSSEFLKISCAPVDLFRLLANRSTATDIPFHTAEQVVEMEVLRRILEKCQDKNSCMPEHTVVCPTPPPVPSPNLEEKITKIEESQAVLLTKLEECPPTSPFLPKNTILICPQAPTVQNLNSADIKDIEEVLITTLQTKLATTRELPLESRVRRKHLRDAYDTPTN